MKEFSDDKIEKNERNVLKEMVKNGVEISIKSRGAESEFKDYVKWEIDFKKDNKIIRKCVIGGLYDIKKGMLDAINCVLRDDWHEIKN